MPNSSNQKTDQKSNLRTYRTWNGSLRVRIRRRPAVIVNMCYLDNTHDGEIVLAKTEVVYTCSDHYADKVIVQKFLVEADS